jgi:hypothetical protein
MGELQLSVFSANRRQPKHLGYWVVGRKVMFDGRKKRDARRKTRAILVFSNVNSQTCAQGVLHKKASSKK